MERQDILDGFADVAAEQLGITADKVTEEARFAEDLGLDSLDLVEFVMEVEEKFSVKIDDDELKGVLTVGQAVDLVAGKQAAAPAEKGATG